MKNPDAYSFFFFLMWSNGLCVLSVHWLVLRRFSVRHIFVCSSRAKCTERGLLYGVAAAKISNGFQKVFQNSDVVSEVVEVRELYKQLESSSVIRKLEPRFCCARTSAQLYALSNFPFFIMFASQMEVLLFVAVSFSLLNRSIVKRWMDVSLDKRNFKLSGKEDTTSFLCHRFSGSVLNKNYFSCILGIVLLF